jgi:hypothetical protein
MIMAVSRPPLDGEAFWSTIARNRQTSITWTSLPDEERIDRAVFLLSSMLRKLPDQVAALIESYVGTSEAWRDRLVYISQWSDPGAGRGFFNLFLRLIDEGVLDEARGPIAVNSDFWSIVYGLQVTHPDWACEVIGHYCQRRLVLSLAAGQSNPFNHSTGTIPDSQLDDEIFVASARGAPEAFITHVLPFMLRVMTLTARQEGEAPWVDPVWGYRFYGENYSIRDALLTAMETALANLAAHNPEVFATIATQLQPLDFETVQYLLIRAYTANGVRFADETVEYLCERPTRLRTDYLDSSHWATRQLLEATTPHCSDAHLTRLERTILNYYPDEEKSIERRHARGHAQLVLLEGIVPSRRSPAVIGRLAEWQRKFGIQSAKAPQPVQVRSVESPIPESAADKMTDDQWLRAMARYEDHSLFSKSDGTLRGGADALASLLERQVAKEPARFAALVCQFPDTTHASYFQAVLRGISGANLEVHTVLRVCQRCHQLPNRPYGHSITQLIAGRAQAALPREALDMVAWYAIEDPDPEQERWRTQEPSGGRHAGDDIHISAINSVRGRAAEAVRDLIFHDGSRLGHFLPTLDRMVEDPSIAVRSCVASTLRAVLRHDRDLAVRYFRQLCETADVLLQTPSVERFLHYALHTHFAELSPILTRMLSSILPDAVTVGARQACVASLTLEEAHPLAHRCVSGTDAQRVGAAEVFATNLREANCRSFCEDRLIQLFNDPEEKVRAAASGCFHGLAGEDIRTYTHLVEAFAHSLAFATHYRSIVYTLGKTTAPLPLVTCLVCERLLEAVGVNAADIRTAHAVDAHQVSQLLVRIYSQNTDPTLQARCLDIIDRMTQIGVYGLEDALEPYGR